MTLIECQNTREIPTKPLELYSLGKGETVADVEARFKSRFGVEPKVGYHWGAWVYVERPEGI